MPVESLSLDKCGEVKAEEFQPAKDVPPIGRQCVEVISLVGIWGI